MKHDDFIQAANVAVHEFSSAVVDEVKGLATERVLNEQQAVQRMEDDALKAAVMATKVWLRLRLGREALIAESKKGGN
jgi:hypothetical protein